jgi:hypothetical protein
MKKSVLMRFLSLFSLLLMGACTQGLVDGPTPAGPEGFKPGLGSGAPTADLPSREELLQSSKYLEFPNFDAFTKAVVAATQAEPTRQFAWEKSQGFVSLKHLLEREVDNFIANEAPKFAQMGAEGAKEAEARIQNGLKAYRGFITYSNENAFELAVSPSAYGHLLNRDGVVKIGPDLYQFTADRMKVVRGGDATKIPDLFGTTASDPARGIEVTDIRAGAGPVLSSGRTESHIYSTYNQGFAGAAGQVQLILYNELYVVNGQYQFWVKWRSLRLNSAGNWYYVNDRDDISGDGTYTFTGQSTYSWFRPPIYRHTHEELICDRCASSASLACFGGFGCLWANSTGFKRVGSITVRCGFPYV